MLYYIEYLPLHYLENKRIARAFVISSLYVCCLYPQLSSQLESYDSAGALDSLPSISTVSHHLSHESHTTQYQHQIGCRPSSQGVVLVLRCLHHSPSFFLGFHVRIPTELASSSSVENSLRYALPFHVHMKECRNKSATLNWKTESNAESSRVDDLKA